MTDAFLHQHGSEVRGNSKDSSRDHAPSTEAGTSVRSAPSLPPVEPLFCDLCGEPTVADRAVFDATGLNICSVCLETHLQAEVRQ